MMIDVNDEELTLLAELLASRIQELHPTIRRSRVYACTDGLKRDLEVLQKLLQRLQSAESVQATN